MASYLHTCPSCGVEMTVHDRYYGRTLRCTGCRTEFVADPAAAAASPPSSRVPPTTRHTCTACGATMTIPERYYGRTLRCTACGETFVARLPVAPASAPPPAPPPAVEKAAPAPVPHPAAPVAAPDPAARSRRTRGILVIGVLAVALGALLWWLGGNREEGFGSSLFAAEKQRTQIGELRVDGEAMVPVALDREAFDELEAAAGSADPAALQAFRSSPRCLSLAAGTRVRVLERRKYDTEARVRILDGPQSSRIVWVPITWVK
jgi:predicted RNA-binding Zn-ribbon protein involved in translation (DUF1610 family)